MRRPTSAVHIRKVLARTVLGTRTRVTQPAIPRG